MISRFVRFKSTLPDEWTFDARGNVIDPGGRRHAELLYPSLKSGILKNTKEPWNEDYAWEFIGKVNGVNISFIVGGCSDTVDAEKQFQVLISAFSLFAWMFRERSEQAVSVASQALVDILRADQRMSDIQNITYEEDQKLTEITRQQLRVKRK